MLRISFQLLPRLFRVSLFVFFYALATFGPNAPAQSFMPTQKGVKNENPLTVSAQLKNPKIPIGSNTELLLLLDLAEGHHAYLDQFHLKVVKPDYLKVAQFTISPVVDFFDPFSKKQRKSVYGRAELKAAIEPTDQAPTGPLRALLELRYQACTKDYCLFPITLPVEIEMTVMRGSDHNLGFGLSNLKGLFEQSLQDQLLLAFFIVFVAGFLTSLTPCIFPMIPITLAVLGAREQKTKMAGFLVSLSYVTGIAITYSILGVIAAATGSLFGSLLGKPIVAILIAVVLIAMGLSLFGLFEIKLPYAITKHLESRKTSGTWAGAFAMGLLAGVVASPCVGPVLVTLLTYVAKTQNLVLGFFLLFTFAFGMGQLFLALGAFNHWIQHLPRSGPWMMRVKAAFGVAMFGLAIYYLLPLLPKEKAEDQSTTAKVTRFADYPKLAWKPYSDEALVAAAHAKKPVIIDFYADWCVACKELEIYTFTDERIRKLSEQFTLLHFDATKSTDTFSTLQRRYHIVGLPNLVFYDRSGNWREDLTLTGFEKADAFLKRMNEAAKP